MIYRVWNGKEYLSGCDYVIGNKGELLLSYAYLSNHHKDFNCDGDYTVVSNDEIFKYYKIEWGFTYGGVDYYVGDIVCTLNFDLEFIDVVDNDVAYFKFKGKSLDSFMSSLENPDAEIKVIGNINENPELLETKDG